MYWDVIAVKAEPGCCLLVQFRDGLSGRVQFVTDELTGALAPLQDPDFFRKVFVDGGAVAWPGDIDLAPDAMYHQILVSSGKLRSFTPCSADPNAY